MEGKDRVCEQDGAIRDARARERDKVAGGRSGRGGGRGDGNGRRARGRERERNRRAEIERGVHNERERVARGCVMFSTNWVSRSPHRALRRTSTGTYTHRRALVHRRGVPTALLLTQPRLVRSPCDASTSRRRRRRRVIHPRRLSLPCTLKAKVTFRARERVPLLFSLSLSRWFSSPFARETRALQRSRRLRREKKR